jgi:hypothetical protein
MLRLGSVLAVATALVVQAAACSSGPLGVDVCKTIETARCQQAASCPGLSLQPPVWTSGTGVEACIRYYDTACLHGLPISSEPASSEVNACVAAIQQHGCAIVEVPENDPACTWLVPPAQEVEAGEDAADAATDASTE